MPQPDFSDEEKFLINYVKAEAASKRLSSATGYYLAWTIPTAILFGCGIFYNNTLLAIAAFIILIAFTLYNTKDQNKWTEIWCSVLNKYEKALETDEENVNK